MSVLGVPFFLAGIFLAFTGKWPGLLAQVSVVFLAVGAMFMFGRRWLTLDVGSGSVTRSYGLLVPIKRQERRLSDFTAVVSTFAPGDSESPDRYPVRLRALSGTDFPISSPTKFVEARKQAEFLSRFLRLPLADNVTDHELIVRPEQVGETLQQRLRSSGAISEIPLRPQSMRSEVNQSQGKTTITIRGRFPLTAILLPLAVVVIGVPLLWRLFSGTPLAVAAVFIAFVVFGFAVVPLRMGVVNKSKTVVTGSPAGIVIERNRGWRNQTTTISAADILDLDYSTFDGTLESVRRSAGRVEASGIATSRLFSLLTSLVPSKGIVIKSPQGLITFAEGLRADELMFLRAVLTRALVGR